MTRVIVLSRARRDLRMTADHLEEQGGIDLADRFLTGVQTSFEMLAGNPLIGVPCSLPERGLEEIRRWPVEGFENWLIFYQPSPEEVHVVHVMHGARN